MSPEGGIPDDNVKEIINPTTEHNIENNIREQTQSMEAMHVNTANDKTTTT